MDLETLYREIKEKKLIISTDTRTLQPGNIYIAIKGEMFDGNTFAKDAIEKGARYAVIDNPDYVYNDQCILVDNTRLTLELLAQRHRNQFSIPILAIGGSNGKTTTKELIHAVLSKKYRTHTTKGNLNNDIGVPLTMLAMSEDTQCAVIEIGANHADEHTKLLDIIRPTHVLVTNNGRDHLEGFGSIEGVRSANKEIYDWALSNAAFAFVPKAYPDLIEDSQDLNRMLYPEKEHTSISGTYASISYDNIDVHSALFGSYNEANILAAITVGEYFSVPLFDIKVAIESYKPTLKRSELIKRDRYSLVLDCYNANPTSMTLALKDFCRITTPGSRIILIGDMLEMGTIEAAVHKEILELVRELVATEDQVLVVGPRFNAFASQFSFQFFEMSDSTRVYFNTLPIDGKQIFVKASRGIKLEEVIKEKIPL